MTVFDHLRECAANGDTPTLDAEDAARIVKTVEWLIDLLPRASQQETAKATLFEGSTL